MPTPYSTRTVIKVGDIIASTQFNRKYLVLEIDFSKPYIPSLSLAVIEREEQDYLKCGEVFSEYLVNIETGFEKCNMKIL